MTLERANQLEQEARQQLAVAKRLGLAAWVAAFAGLLTSRVLLVKRIERVAKREGVQG